jgi:hypothetical protein
MTNRNVSVHTALSCLLWPLGVGLVVFGFFADHAFGQLGIIVAMVAAVLNVRGFFCCLERRERQVFEMGQDSVRSIR